MDVMNLCYIKFQDLCSRLLFFAVYYESGKQA